MSSESLLLPPGARLVHIGPHKTGSTAIQVALQEAGAGLEPYDVHYSTGRRHRPDKAGWALGVKGRPAGSKRPPMSHWNALVADVAAAGEQRVCISNEDFGRATRPQIRTMVDAFGADRVHVVAVARRLDRYLPSQWQERVKAGDQRTFDDWLHVVLERDSDEFAWDRQNVWFAHDTAQLVKRWVNVVGADRFTLIVSDEADRQLLPGTFEGLLGLPDGTLRPNPSRSNRGLSWAETELVRAVNVAVAEQGLSRAQRRAFVKQGVLKDMQGRPTPAGPKNPPFPQWAVEPLRALSDRRVEEIRDLGVRVVGDPQAMRIPDDLEVDAGPTQPPGVGADIAAAAVLAVMQVALRAQGAVSPDGQRDDQTEETSDDEADDE